MADGYVTLPAPLMERVLLALNRDALSLPSRDEKIPGVEHECSGEDDEDSCELLHDQWVTRFGEHPLVQEVRAALASENRRSAPTDTTGT